MPQTTAPKAEEESTNEEGDEFEDEDDEDEDEIAPFVNSVFDAPEDPLADVSPQDQKKG